MIGEKLNKAMIKRLIEKIFRRKKEIVTKRLSIRHWRVEDAPRLYELASDPEIGNAGHGYATEAVKALLDYGFRYRSFDGIWCDSYPENSRSANVQRKCGFRVMGDAKDSLWGAGDGSRRVIVSYLPNPCNVSRKMRR